MSSSLSLPRLGATSKDSGPLAYAPASRPGSSASAQPAAPSSAVLDTTGSTRAHNDAASAKHSQSTVLRRLSSSISLQELEQQRERKEASPWVAKYQDLAKRELVDVDIAPLMERFESVSLYHKPQRKPLSVALQEMTASGRPRASEQALAVRADDVSPASSQAPRVAVLPTQKTLKRQATKLIQHQRRSANDKRAATAGAPARRGDELGELGSSLTGGARARIVPSRFLFDTTRWRQCARCDYCSFAGGDLECATCNVIAHARCYLSAYASTPKKTKGAFVVPTRFSWLCRHCQQSLQDEYDERAKHARMQHIALQRHIFGKVVTAYVRMTKDAMVFQTKKKAIVKIQAAFRGRLARLRFDRMLRMVLKPYAVDSLHVRGWTSDLVAAGAVGSPRSLTDDLRLANGFTCNPYVYVSVVDGRDDETQLFCFETSVRKGVSLAEAAADVSWSDKLFVPGVDGNVTFVFTLLSKNGPNHFFLGQAVLRLRDSDVIWRSGVAATELPLSDEVEIFPKTTQRQLLRLVQVSGAPKVHASSSSSKLKRRELAQSHRLFANSSSNSFALTLSVRIQPFSDAHAYCGSLGMKTTLESAQTSARWCVLADGVLRIYRHFGVTLASDVIDMARALDVRLVATGRVTANGVSHREQHCIAIQHVSRLYLLQSEHRAANKVWLKKLQAATKFAAGDKASGSAVDAAPPLAATVAAAASPAAAAAMLTVASSAASERH